MAKNSGVPYADSSFNPVWGCEKCSLGCQYCFAEKQAARFGIYCFGKKPRRQFADAYWREPVRWDSLCRERHVTQTVLCGDMCDIYDSKWPDGVRERLFDLQERTPGLFWLNLTKRIENSIDMLPRKWWDNKLPANIGMGVTVEHSQYMHRLDILEAIPANFAWISCEPLLSPVRLTEQHRFLNMAIIGSESGTHRLRETKEEWVRDLAGDCKRLGIPVYVKQLWAPPIDENHRPRCLKNAGDWPEDLRVQELPNFRKILIAGRKKELSAQQDLFGEIS